MKLLFDQNLSFRLCRMLADVFPGSEQTTRVGLGEADNSVIWEHARRSGLTIVTLDADFAELAAMRGLPPKVIWQRCGNQSTVFVEQLLRANRTTILDFGESDNAACLELYDSRSP